MVLPGRQLVRELILNIIALAIAGVMLFNFLTRRAGGRSSASRFSTGCSRSAGLSSPSWDTTCSRAGSGGPPTCTTSATSPSCSRT